MSTFNVWMKKRNIEKLIAKGRTVESLNIVELSLCTTMQPNEVDLSGLGYTIISSFVIKTPEEFKND